MGYVKGLFCVFEQDNYFLWNPSIRKSISLPKPGITKKTHGTLVDYQGLGFDSLSNDYKVARVILLCGSERPEEEILVEVYSLNTGLWKMNRGAADSYPLGYRIGYSRNFATCLEGALHWVAEARGDRKDKVVLLFHLSDEVFKTIPLPNDITTPRSDIRTTEFEGSLSLLCEDNIDRANKSCSIWIMKEYGVVDSWYKYVKIDLTGGISGVIGIRKNGHILLEGTTPQPWELFSYYPQNKEIKELGINGTIGHFHVDTYEENLILLNKIDVPVSRRGGSRKRKERFPLDQSTQLRIEVQTLATDVERLEHEFAVLQERVKGKIEVAREVIAKMGPQQLAELRTKLQIYSQFAHKDVQGNEEINSMRLTTSSQDSVANDCDVAEKFSNNRILGRGESVKGKHVNDHYNLKVPPNPEFWILLVLDIYQLMSAKLC
ncbi:hypothetical protein Vadar_029826 [Vaccinium darrowii]|uniref:Uncharacterized protein n=1 Tax=Vaccinium darrowii TaxID=229202 RepID=A0ACB7X542_9ERIC|nr:hypothetical protein Vadar_029826 [Vaccinium darrowii]